MARGQPNRGRGQRGNFRGGNSNGNGFSGRGRGRGGARSVRQDFTGVSLDYADINEELLGQPWQYGINYYLEASD